MTDHALSRLLGEGREQVERAQRRLARAVEDHDWEAGDAALADLTARIRGADGWDAL